MKTKQIVGPDSFLEQKRRNDALQSDLLRIVGAMGMSRSLLQRRDNWDNASRDPNQYEPYRPYDRVQTMIRDVVRTVATRGNEKERAAVRLAVTRFYELSMLDALEPLGIESEESVLTLTLESKREISEADCAVTQALSAGTPESFDRAAREETEALSTLERLRDRCLEKARARFCTPRTNKLFAAR